MKGELKMRRCCPGVVVSAVALTAFAVCCYIAYLGDDKPVYWQRFEDRLMDDVYGAVAPGRFGAAEIVDGRYGKCLHVPAGVKGAQVDVPASIVGKRGCVEFWAKVDNGSGMIRNIVDPEFFTLVAGGVGRVALSYSVNGGNGNSGLLYHFWGLAYSSSHEGCSSHPYAEILNTEPAGWHHYALVWNYDEADVAYCGEPLVVYIDGEKRYTAGRPRADGKINPRMIDWLQGTLQLDFSYSRPSLSGYCIDEFKIWKTDKRTWQ